MPNGEPQYSPAGFPELSGLSLAVARKAESITVDANVSMIEVHENKNNWICLPMKPNTPSILSVPKSLKKPITSDTEEIKLETSTSNLEIWKAASSRRKPLTLPFKPRSS